MNKIDKNNIENIMDLTNTQLGMLFHYINAPNREYHEQLSLTIRGDVDIRLLEKAWNKVIETNEVLRTIFRWTGIEKPLQIVLKKNEINIQHKDISKELNSNEVLENLRAKDYEETIDITSKPLRVSLYKVDEEEYEMIISNHHILYDGWSNGIILTELIENYKSLYRGQGTVKAKKTKYSEFVKFNKKINKEDQRLYWSDYLKDLDIKFDHFSSKEKGTYYEAKLSLNHTQSKVIEEYTKENKVTLAAVIYSLWGIILKKISNSNDVIFGTTLSGRDVPIESIEKMVGLFLNVIPLRLLINDNNTLMTLIKDVNKALNDRRKFEHTPLVDIKEWCDLRANDELFNTLVTIENYPLELNWSNRNLLTIEKYSIKEKTNYNLEIDIFHYDNIEFKFKFNSRSTDKEMVDKIIGYFKQLIDLLISNKHAKLYEVDLLSQEEKKKLLYDFNNTAKTYPACKTIQELFEEQVEKTPNNTAIAYDENTLTYRDLNEKANQFARFLRSKGVKRDTMVAIILERSIEAFIAILAVMKAGGIYIPIDPKYPESRMRYMLIDSEACMIITEKHLISSHIYQGEIIDVNDECIVQQSKVNLLNVNKPTDILYVIYTSGTTGQPKGVQIENRNLVNMAYSYIHHYNLNDRYIRLLQLASISFDVSIGDMCRAFLTGGTMYVCPDDKKMDFEYVSHLINRHKINTFDSTPGWIIPFMNYVYENRIDIDSFNLLVLGSDVCPLKDYIRLMERFGKKIRILNTYGVTETTIDSCYYEEDISKIHNLENTPIGKPICNVKFYVLDQALNLQPINVPGELYIGGESVGRGYLNNEQLTSEKFIDNPFIKGEKIYKTGDRVRWLNDGNIEFLGRIDNQVKLRGFRVELGEIENNILNNSDVLEAAVVLKKDCGEDYICAYVISHKVLDAKKVKNGLRTKLPDYMIPTFIIQLDKMPLTANGKLDKIALTKMDIDRHIDNYEAPRNEYEKKLAEFWSEVLSIEKVGIKENFFELGGHSIKMMLLINKIYKQWHIQITYNDIYNNQTIEELSECIVKGEIREYRGIKKAEKKEYYATTASQKSFYTIQQIEPNSTAYNMTQGFEIIGNLDKDLFESIINQLVNRHEALRTSFKIIDKQIVQIINENISLNIKYLKGNEQKYESIVEGFIQPFELSSDSLLRIELIEITSTKYWLLIDIHHIVCDGFSVELLIQEFVQLYTGNSYPNIGLQNKDYTEWYIENLENGEIKSQENYWIEMYEKQWKTVNLPYDYRRKKYQSFAGSEESFIVKEDVHLGIKRIANDCGVTVFTVLLSAFYIAINKMTGQDDIIIGTPLVGRSHSDLKGIFGMIVNTLPLRVDISENDSIEEFIKAVNKQVFDAMNNQNYQFAQLVQKLNINRDFSRNPLFDIVFVLDHDNELEIKIDNLEIKPIPAKKVISKFDLTLYAILDAESLKINIEYCTELFKEDTIREIGDQYLEVLNTMIKNTYCKITNMPYQYRVIKAGSKSSKDVEFKF